MSTWAQGGQKAALEPTPCRWACMGKRSVLAAVAGVPEPEESETGDASGIDPKERQALVCCLAAAEREAWLFKPLSHQPEPKASVPYTHFQSNRPHKTMSSLPKEFGCLLRPWKPPEGGAQCGVSTTQGVRKMAPWMWESNLTTLLSVCF